MQHHPDRAHLLPALLDALHVAEVITDPAAGTPDESPLNCYLECLRRTPDWATHRVIIQDDAIVCASFHARLRWAIETHPDALIPLFVGGGSPWRGLVHRARMNDVPWVRMYNPPMVPTVGLVWPAEMAPQFVQVMEEKIAGTRQRLMGDDGWVGKWAIRTKAPVWCPLPSLVQHPDIEASLIGRKAAAGRNMARVAAWYTGT